MRFRRRHAGAFHHLVDPFADVVGEKMIDEIAKQWGESDGGDLLLPGHRGEMDLESALHTWFDNSPTDYWPPIAHEGYRAIRLLFAARDMEIGDGSIVGHAIDSVIAAVAAQAATGVLNQVEKRFGKKVRVQIDEATEATEDHPTQRRTNHEKSI